MLLTVQQLAVSVVNDVCVDRLSLPDDAPSFFDPEVRVLGATVDINVVNQVHVCFFA